MKNLIIALLLAASCMTACKNENPSKVAQKRQELETKRAELKEKQELAALEDELKKWANGLGDRQLFDGTVMVVV